MSFKHAIIYLVLFVQILCVSLAGANESNSKTSLRILKASSENVGRASPTVYPTAYPSAYPTAYPTGYPTNYPTEYPSNKLVSPGDDVPDGGCQTRSTATQ